MIQYDQGVFGVGFAFSLAGSVFPKSGIVALPCAILSCIFHVGLRSYTDVIGNWEYMGSTRNEALTGFTTVLGFLIVFRSQQAYSRWWEGGTLLQQMRGEWFNAYSSLLAFTNPAPEKHAEVHDFQQQIVRLFSLLHASALEQVTTMNLAGFETIELLGFDLESLIDLQNAHDKCEVVLQWLQRVIVQCHSTNVIMVAPPILTRVFNQLANGIVNLNNARKITEFPFPFPLAQTTTFMLILHWWFTAYVCVVYLPGPITAAGTSFVVVFAFWTINYISLELEVPFGNRPNDLPLDSMQRDFNLSLSTLLKPNFINPPVYSPDPDCIRLYVHIGTYSSHLEVMARTVLDQTQTEGKKALNEARARLERKLTAAKTLTLELQGTGPKMPSGGGTRMRRQSLMKTRDDRKRKQNSTSSTLSSRGGVANDRELPLSLSSTTLDIPSTPSSRSVKFREGESNDPGERIVQTESAPWRHAVDESVSLRALRPASQRFSNLQLQEDACENIAGEQTDAVFSDATGMDINNDADCKENIEV